MLYIEDFIDETWIDQLRQSHIIKKFGIEINAIILAIKLSLLYSEETMNKDLLIKNHEKN
jgi:hypothetical protein